MMMVRCGNKNFSDYDSYGGAGISVCDRWQDFSLFLLDMRERPNLKYSLDRYPDQAGNYEPGNCRWATAVEKCRNRKSNRVVINSKGEVFATVIEASEKTGIGRLQIYRSCTGIVKNPYSGISWRYADDL